MYVDAAYCYRPSSVVCRSVDITLMSRAKTAGPIEMPFGLWTRVCPGNHVLDGGPDTPWEGAILILKYNAQCLSFSDAIPKQRLSRAVYPSLLVYFVDSAYK